MRRKGAGFFGVIECEHIVNYSENTICKQLLKLSEKHLAGRIYYGFIENTIFYFFSYIKSWELYWKVFFEKKVKII